MTIILHVGAPKCGSSAIQTSMSQNPSLHRIDGSAVEYVSIAGRTGQLLRGEQLRKEAERDVHGYVASPKAADLLNFDLEQLGSQLHRIEHDAVLSYEGWISEPGKWAEILSRIGIKVHVVAYVRPHVDLLNSSWWQWGAWSGQSFDVWMGNRIKANMWWQLLNTWKSLDCVESCTVRLLQGDVVHDFYTRVLRTEAPKEKVLANSSMPSVVLRLFQRKRQLRPGQHDSKIEFMLGRLLDLQGASPWVLDDHWIERILSETKADNTKLLSLLDEQSAAAMQNDERWWNASAYSDKVAEPHGPISPDLEQLEDLSADLILALKRCVTVKRS